LASVIKVDQIQSDTGTVNLASNISFTSAANITGNTNFDSGTLFVDATNDRVGMGTNSPLTKLDVLVDSGNTIARFRNNNSTVGTLGEVQFIAPNRPAFRFNFQTSIDTNGFINYDTREFKFFADNSSGSAVERMRLNSTGDLLFNSGYGSLAVAYGCRAWVNFDGTGTPAIRGSGNVSSVSDIGGNGNYTVNFTTVMPDVNYSAVITSRATGSNLFSPSFASGFSTGNMNFITVNSSGVATDSDTVCCAVFR
jgi:hypothetical protein